MLFCPLRVLSRSYSWPPLHTIVLLDPAGLYSAAALQQPGCEHSTWAPPPSLSVHKSITSVFQPSNVQFRSRCTAHDIRVGPIAILYCQSLCHVLTLLANSLPAARLCSHAAAAKPFWADQALPHKIVSISTFRFGSHPILRSDDSAQSLPVR